MSRPVCEGLQVIEMGAGSIGAAFAGMLLADNGARVLKVEPPDGDRLRRRHRVRVPRLEPRQGEPRRRSAHRGRSARAARRCAGRRRRGPRGLRRRCRRALGSRRRRRPRHQPAPRLLLRSTGFGPTGAYAALDQATRACGGQGRRLRLRDLRLPDRADLLSTPRSAALGAGSHGVQPAFSPPSSPREQTGRGQHARRHVRPGLQPPRLLRHHAPGSTRPTPRAKSRGSRRPRHRPWPRPATCCGSPPRTAAGSRRQGWCRTRRAPWSAPQASNTSSTSPASPTPRSSPPRATPRTSRTSCGRRSAPRRSTSGSPSPC